MLKIMQKIIKEQNICTVYEDEEDLEYYLLGKIVYADENWYVLSAIDDFGYELGYEVRQTPKVFRIDEDGQYERAMTKLWKKRQNGPNIAISFDNFNLHTILSTIQKSDFFLSIWLHEEQENKFVGRVIEVEQDTVKIQNRDDSGAYDGIMTFPIDAIHAMSIETKLENKFRLLSEMEDE